MGRVLPPVTLCCKNWQPEGYVASIAVVVKGTKHLPGQGGDEERGRRFFAFNLGNEGCSVDGHPGCVSTSSVFYLWD